MIWFCYSCVILAQDLKTHDQLNFDNLPSVVSEDIVRQQRGFNPSVRCKPLLEMAKATANMGVFDDYIYRILAKECPTKKTLRYALRNFLLSFKIVRKSLANDVFKRNCTKLDLLYKLDKF